MNLPRGKQPPALSPEEWRALLDLLQPHGVYPLLAYRLRVWPDRAFLSAAARTMRAGRQTGIPPTVTDGTDARYRSRGVPGSGVTTPARSGATAA
jgi:hypothetical protein